MKFKEMPFINKFVCLEILECCMLSKIPENSQHQSICLLEIFNFFYIPQGSGLVLIILWITPGPFNKKFGSVIYQVHEIP